MLLALRNIFECMIQLIVGVYLSNLILSEMIILKVDCVLVDNLNVYGDEIYPKDFMSIKGY